MRPEVQWFAEVMLWRMTQERREARRTADKITKRREPVSHELARTLSRECADIANFAMMIADVATLMANDEESE